MTQYDETWVRFYRKQIENGWLKNHKLWVFWTYCLLRASYKERTIKIGFQDVEIKPGQFIFGRLQASKDLNMSEQSIRTCLNALKKSQNITIKTTNKFSIITVINWSTYQVEEKKVTNKTTNDQPTTNHKQESKEINNIYPEWLNLELWKNYKSHRIALKSKLTPQAEKLNINKLKKITDKGFTQEQIINLAIENGWKGLFEPKNVIPIKKIKTVEF